MMVLGIFQQSNHFQFEVLETLKRFLEQTQNAFDMAWHQVYKKGAAYDNQNLFLKS